MNQQVILITKPKKLFRNYQKFRYYHNTYSAQKRALDICNKILLMNDGTITDQGSLNYFKDKYSNFETYIN